MPLTKSLWFTKADLFNWEFISFLSKQRVWVIVKGLSAINSCTWDKTQGKRVFNCLLKIIRVRYGFALLHSAMWLKNLSPRSQPIRILLKQNRTRFYLACNGVRFIYLLRDLIGFLGSISFVWNGRLDWLGFILMEEWHERLHSPDLLFFLLEPSLTDLTASKEERNLPAAFSMLEATVMSTNSRCLSFFSRDEDRTFFYE